MAPVLFALTPLMLPRIQHVPLPSPLPYGQALALQYRLRQSLIEQPDRDKRIGYLLSLQHPLTVTIGKRGTVDALLGRHTLKTLHAEVFKIDRGGEATLHNPGQLVLYPILTLNDYKLCVVDVVRKTAHAAIHALKQYNVDATYDTDLPGVWSELSEEQMNRCGYVGLRRRKLASVGMRITKGVSIHGMAVNVVNDTSQFSLIAACGIENSPMARVADVVPEVSYETFRDQVVAAWGELVGVDVVDGVVDLPPKEAWEQENVAW